MVASWKVVVRSCATLQVRWGECRDVGRGTFSLGEALGFSDRKCEGINHVMFCTSSHTKR